jgi:glycosyltransferase involved in cell wall biosynthesis
MVNKETLISVIIPTRNSETTLKQCINSITNQTYKNYEVIIVDNNSTDNTKSIINEFQKNDKSIKYYFEEIQGRGQARNAGIKHAKGKTIAMIDSDCIAPKNWLKEITNPILKENEMVVMGGEEDKIKNYWTKNIQFANSRFIQRNLNGKYISHLDTKNFAIQADLMKKFMFDPKLKFFEDFDLYLRIKKISKIRYLPELKVMHMHKNSFNNVIKINFNRAYWCYKIYKKYKNEPGVKKEPMFESISFKNFFSFPFWMILQFFTKPSGEAYFILVSELSWRGGLICGMINIY